MQHKLHLYIFLFTILIATACTSQNPENLTPSITSAPQIRPRGQAIEILYDDAANNVRHFLFPNPPLGIRWPPEAYADGWRPWLAKVMIQSDEGCLTSIPDSSSKDKANIIITDTGGYTRNAAIMIHPSIYGLRWHICDEMSVMAYVWGIIPRNQSPVHGTFEMNGRTVPIDFTISADPSFPIRADSQRRPETIYSINNYGIEIMLKALSSEPDTNALILEVNITNNGGYDVGGVTFLAVDNLGRYYNDSSGSPARVAPGITETRVMRVYNPFPSQRTGDISSVTFIVFAETTPRQYQYMGTFYTQLPEATLPLEPTLPLESTMNIPDATSTANAMMLEEIRTQIGIPENCVLHIIQAGDTPFSIAEQYGANLITLFEVNRLSEEDALLLEIGHLLVVPLEGCTIED